MSINFFHTHISNNSKAIVNQVLDSGLLSEGAVVAEFEKKIEQFLNVRNVLSVNSGTTALHLALILAGISEGDEVIIPSQTFVATGLAVLMVKAKPVFADIDLSTGNICIKSIKERITSKTKAIIPVHWAGYPCDMDEINSIAKEYDIKVIEDAAHAFGAKYKGSPIGSLSDFTCFSFQAIKHLTTGDGGAISILNKKDFQEGKKLRWFGIDRANSPMSNLGEREYDLNILGYKYHLNNYAAALGIANLTDMEDVLSRRAFIADRYKSEFSDFDGVELMKYHDYNTCAWWLFTIKVERREDFIEKMNSLLIPVSVVHVGIHKNSIFQNTNVLENQKIFDAKQISIPIHSGLTDEQVEQIIRAIKSGW
jgi:perosamine synthetase